MRIMQSGIHYSVSPFYQLTGTTIFSPISHFAYIQTQDEMKKGTYEPTVYDANLLLLLSVATFSTFMGMILQSRAYQLEKAARIASLQYSNIVICYLWDYLFFDSKFKLTDYIGSFLIVSVIFTISVLKARGKV